MIRLFIALDLPWELKERLALLCGGIPGARWIASENFHLTLRFIGEVFPTQAEEIDLACAARRIGDASERLAPGQRIHQAGFADIGTADEGHFGKVGRWNAVQARRAQHEVAVLREEKTSALLGLRIPRRGIGLCHQSGGPAGFSGACPRRRRAPMPRRRSRKSTGVPVDFMITTCWMIDRRLFHVQ